jgi:hypothetical protein
MDRIHTDAIDAKDRGLPLKRQALARENRGLVWNFRFPDNRIMFSYGGPQVKLFRELLVG